MIIAVHGCPGTFPNKCSFPSPSLPCPLELGQLATSSERSGEARFSNMLPWSSPKIKFSMNYGFKSYLHLGGLCCLRQNTAFSELLFSVWKGASMPEHKGDGSCLQSRRVAVSKPPSQPLFSWSLCLSLHLNKRRQRKTMAPTPSCSVAQLSKMGITMDALSPHPTSVLVPMVP